MDSYLTLVGSIVIGGIFLLGLLSFHGDMIDQSHQKNFELLAQENAAAMMEIIDHDFTRIGSGLSSPAFAIMSADTVENTTEITFQADLDEDGVADTVQYLVSTTAAAAATENPNDRILYRIVNGDSTVNTPFGVRRFRLRIKNRQGNNTMDLMAASMIEILLRVESTFAYDGVYGAALWEKRFMPQSLYRIPRN